MSKVRKILSIVFLLFFGLSVYFPHTVSAATCSFTYYDSKDPPTPITPNQNMDNLKIIVTSRDLAPNTYRLTLWFPNNNNPTKRDLQFSTETGVSTEFNKPATGWQKGKYFLYLIQQDKTGNAKDIFDCSTEFTMAEIASQETCQASIPTHPIEPGTEVILHVGGLNPSDRPALDLTGTEGYDIIVNNEVKIVYSTNNGPDINLGGKFNVGTYLVEIRNRCGWVGTSCPNGPKLQCNSVGFKVAPKGSGGGGEIAPSDVSQKTQCKNPGDESYDPAVDSLCTSSKVEGCGGEAIKTAIGCIHTTPAGFVKDFLTFTVAVGGGIAFLMMLLGAYGMITSAGNPDALKGATDRFTSAIIGLLFVIFAVLLMQIIGVGILAIPGFTP